MFRETLKDILLYIPFTFCRLVKFIGRASFGEWKLSHLPGEKYAAKNSPESDKARVLAFIVGGGLELIALIFRSRSWAPGIAMIGVVAALLVYNIAADG